MFNLKYIPKFPQFILLLLALFIFSSCEREMTNEIISTTPPELHVLVYKGADKTARVEGVSVKLYASAADRTANANVIATVITNNKGEAIFTQDKFRKGVMYISASKDATTVAAETPYLLQNDGKTTFGVSF